MPHLWETDAQMERNNRNPDQKMNLIPDQTPEAASASATRVGPNAILDWLRALMKQVTAVTADCITLISPRLLIRDEMCDRSPR